MTEPGSSDDRVFFSSTGRTLALEDEIRLLSVGVDIGSSTSHLVFSRIVLERLDARYVVAARAAIYQSPILLTPYEAAETIDAAALGAFIARQYEAAGIARDAIDTGALILTGVAVRRRNARAIGELFAREAGKLVAVSAGDGLETTMAAYGSGAVARSIRERAPVLNVDVGGGTAKIAVCEEGRITALTALDMGARLIALDDAGRIVRIEEAGRHFADALGLTLAPGMVLGKVDATRLAALMVDRLFEAIDGGSPCAGAAKLLRVPPLAHRGAIADISFSGGVAEYIYGAETKGFGDLGPLIAGAIRDRVAARGLTLVRPSESIRATVIGASQYTIQVSGSTIYVAPLEVLPLRNLPVVAPDLPVDGEAIEPDAVAAAIAAVLARLDLAHGESPVAVFVPWHGSATFARIDGFCRGVLGGLDRLLAQGHPLVLAGDGDIGGLLGIHCREELGLDNAIVSIDGIELKEFDYIDIGAMIESSGAVPVVIKSLIFPASAPG
ncbi:MAG TPA: ethanolamine ammonia-lyase reactivating factor EutA [Stellaceae bacterium]|nr:ethanolamine ammonia-lyase reactivating factor EutA [Stellaceae bacterium]